MGTAACCLMGARRALVRKLASSSGFRTRSGSGEGRLDYSELVSLELGEWVLGPSWIHSGARSGICEAVPSDSSLRPEIQKSRIILLSSESHFLRYHLRNEIQITCGLYSGTEFLISCHPFTRNVNVFQSSPSFRLLCMILSYHLLFQKLSFFT